MSTKKIVQEVDRYHLYSNLRKGLVFYNEIQEKYNFDYWLVNKNGLLDTSIKHDGIFEEFISDDDYIVYKTK